MKIVLVGCGTTGNHVLPHLHEDVFLIDRDIVERVNLERQPLFSPADIGKAKAEVLGKKFGFSYAVADLDCESISLLADADLVIECTDNLETRFLINEYCVKNKIPWIYTGIVGKRGRVMKVDGDYCFRCVFSEVKGLDTCSTVGVDLAAAQELGNIAAEEVQRKSRGLWANGSWVKIKRNEDCPVCHGRYAYLEGKKEKIVKFCGSSRYQFKGNFNFEDVKERLHGSGEWFVHKDFYVFKDRVLVKAENEKEAKKKFTEVIGM
ncbi:ThiF family adenylyltransferase [Candidatus Woesearchaeota archaeon]|nr:ThiF family adenylyltransferase [Candidatus Woesearchaeota archaeon]